VNILGLDTSTSASAAAVLRDDDAGFARDPEPGALLGPPGHSHDLLPAAAAALDRAGLQWTDLDAVAVGVGPGAFTGLRIGVTTARALAAAHDLELYAVSSLEALAQGIDDPLALPLLDARRGEMFAALYDGGREVWPAFAAAPDALLARLADAPGPPVAAGNGSLRFRQVLEDGGVCVSPAGSSAHVVSALSICRLARTMAPTPFEAALPNYLREPDAQPQ
jgi:tRNA threonylcarbamoyladenosine biosynthesis protein TsaB